MTVQTDGAVDGRENDELVIEIAGKKSLSITA
jgi:hypothetical protein